MKVILIFAGRSTRFWPLTEKNFFPIAGTTLLLEQAKRLKVAGFKDKDILLVGGDHNRALAKGAFPKLRFIEQEDLLLGMRGALLSALPLCGKNSVMIVSGNDIIDASGYRALLSSAKRMKEGGRILARTVDQYFPGGYLSVRGKRITGIVEKPAPGKEPSNLVNIVAHIHASAAVLLKALEKVKPTRDDGYEVALDALFQRHRYEAVPYRGTWQPVKYPWHLLDLLPFLLPMKGNPKIHKTAQIHRTAVIEGPVTIGPGVRVFAHATVMGPCTIGSRTIIANNALVRGSSVGSDCVIGYGTEIARSILGRDVWTHMSYVGDSLLGDSVSLGSGTITGNLRLDEEPIRSAVGEEMIDTHRTKFGVVIGDNCRIGIHTSLSPGVKIGAGSFLSSVLLIIKDIPENSFVKGKKDGELDIRPNAKRISPESREGFKRKLS